MKLIFFLCYISTTLVSGHLDNNLRFWDVRSGKDIKELTGIHLGQITSVSVSPGKFIVSIS